MNNQSLDRVSKNKDSSAQSSELDEILNQAVKPKLKRDVEAYLNQKIVEELESIQTLYGHYLAQTFINGKPQTIEERILELKRGS